MVILDIKTMDTHSLNENEVSILTGQGETSVYRNMICVPVIEMHGFTENIHES